MSIDFDDLHDGIRVQNRLKITSSNFRKCTEWIQADLNQSDKKSTLYMYFVLPRVPYFRLYRSTIRSSRDMSHMSKTLVNVARFYV